MALGDGGGESRVLVSPLAPEEYRARLAARTESGAGLLKLSPTSDWEWEPLPSVHDPAYLTTYTYRSGTHKRTPLRGRVTREGFAVRKYIPYVNSFQPVATGRFEPQPGGGTCIRVEMSLARSVRLNLGVVRAVLVLCAGLAIGLAVVAYLVPGSVAVHGSVASVVGAVVISAAVGAMLRTGAKQTAGEDEFLLRVLKETLQADEATTAPEAADRSRAL